MTTMPLDTFTRSIPVLGLGTVQNVAYTGTAGTISNAVASGTQIVRVYCTTDAHIAIGTAPTATANDSPVTAGQAEYFKIKGGTGKVSAMLRKWGKL